MNIGNMSSKQLRVGVKNGMSTQDFCLKYGCSEDDFRARIVQLYGHNKKDAENLLSAIKANDKKVKKNSKPTPCDNQVVETIAEAVSQQMQREQVDFLKGINNGQTELEALLSLEESLSQEIITIEGKHKSEVEAHRECLKGMREIRESIILLQDGIRNATKEFETLVAQANTHVESMNQLSDERRPLVEKLASTRARIEELRTITLAVYDSGEITALEQEYALDDTGYEELYSQLLNDPRCEEVRMKDIRVLARLVQITSRIKDSKVVLLCDRPEVEEVYYKMISGDEQ